MRNYSQFKCAIMNSDYTMTRAMYNEDSTIVYKMNNKDFTKRIIVQSTRWGSDSVEIFTQRFKELTRVLFRNENEGFGRRSTTGNIYTI